MASAIRVLSLCVVAAALLASSTASARNMPTALVCGQVLVADAVLTVDLHCAGPGLSIAADGLTLDLNGHRVIGSGVGDGVFVGANNDTVQNGTIKGFQHGVRGGSFLSGATLDHLTLAGNDSGVLFDLIPGSVVQNSTISHNNVDGVVDTGGAQIRNNVINDNGQYGVETAPGVGGVTTIENNTISRNGGGGIQTGGHFSIMIGNTIRNNGGNGINVADVPGLGGGVITDNVANGNDLLGISVCISEGPGPCTAEGVVDGGGNSAKNNGDARQCLNIVCARKAG